MSEPVRRLGLVGVGRMGSAIGSRLLSAGWPLVITDIRPKASEPLVREGATVAASPSEVADAADLVLVLVVDDEQVRQVSTAVVAAAAPGTVVAICASVRPSTCRELADIAEETGVVVVDAALARGERGAEAGELLLLCGGPSKDIDRCRPAFGAFATDVFRVGDVGAGQVAKTVNNILLWTCLRADVEAQRLGRALGVEPSTLRAAVALGSGANRPLDEWGEHRLRWPAKDLEVALSLAEEVGVDLPFVRTLAPLMAELSLEDVRELL